MVLSGDKSVVSYDPRTGQEYWSMDGPTEQFVASMVFDGSLFFVTAGFPDHHILAIRPDGSGNVSESHIVWRTQRGAAYVPSPVVIGKYLLVVSDSGIASCFDTATGTRHWMQRIGPGYSSSAVAADGQAYFLANNGVMTVIRPGVEFEVIAENALGQPCSASPAISGGRLFIRGEQDLFCIGH
jgi:outer membrane protein assembly factor BamB